MLRSFQKEGKNDIASHFINAHHIANTCAKGNIWS